ncbi:hypothetical protein CI102_2662 [Trichoderma harzianum]|uniref:Uncharacterized protein n=1 Tax=Trichoderma harzianum CBS 226.95 TaxID=983964 RepID=A0A2T4AFA8_TRIHA|nr:hypothetical protein M431DRAFT_406818 [Trichoderma harzianum CBS 226.95]PKK52564.1 hypothetical protein CI102_2662 [Trichoderma harzianum]PTB55692.1 hypothetical protein M431DRAFT_406818 [Trichoderma harzianum CBS 226.95]
MNFVVNFFGSPALVLSRPKTPPSSPPKNPVPRSASQLINYITPLERYSASAPLRPLHLCVYVLVVVVVLGSSFS